MKNWTEEKQLDSGWLVRLRPVPPLASSEVRAKPEFDPPPPPKVTVKTLAGTEQTEAPEDSAAFAAYWQKCRDVDRRATEAGRDFTYNYGVVAWSENGKKWLNRPPDDWELDEILAQALGAKDRKSRLAFVKYQLIATTDDLETVNKVIYSIREPTAQEVASAEVSFQDSVQGQASE